MRIGEYIAQLANRRAESGPTLAEISRDTKISLRYLEAIERGDLQELPAGIYRLNYLVQYAGLIDDSAVGEVRALLADDPEVCRVDDLLMDRRFAGAAEQRR